MKTAHATITGRVQGVGYRAWTVDMARRLGLKGWVRNRRDRSVEAVFHGSAEKIEIMREQCRKGPLMARVLDVRFSDMEPDEEFQGFTSKPTL